MYDKLLNKLSKPGTQGVKIGISDIPFAPLDSLIPAELLDERKPDLPQISEGEVVRHFIALSNKNYHLDKGFYPLGSCTMKYNPKINDAMAQLFKSFHPLQPAETVQAPLRVMYELGEYLKEIGGMDDITLQPAAGAQGEFTALLLARAYFKDKGLEKTEVILPDSAHGTNPASVIMAGYKVVEIKSRPDGLVDLEELKKAISPRTAMFMITNPNTLGLFERQIGEIAAIAHQNEALLYMDGANLNALLGIVRPGDMGFDIVHYNLHKTFATPHGGGGPGAGALGVKGLLSPYLPVPVARKENDVYRLDFDIPLSIGKLMNFWGNFGVMARAWCYIRILGAQGLKKVSQRAIINANYLMRKLEPLFDLPYPADCMHEFVLSSRNLKERDIKTTHIAKRLLDYGFHAPTIYFPLIVPEAMMIEPTETESKETLDAFTDALTKIVSEDPEMLKHAPHCAPLKRLNEALAAKNLKIHW